MSLVDRRCDCCEAHCGRQPTRDDELQQVCIVRGSTALMLSSEPYRAPVVSVTEFALCKKCRSFIGTLLKRFNT